MPTESNFPMPGDSDSIDHYRTPIEVIIREAVGLLPIIRIGRLSIQPKR